MIEKLDLHTLIATMLWWIGFASVVLITSPIWIFMFIFGGLCELNAWIKKHARRPKWLYRP
jgi:hypothetical protein